MEEDAGETGAVRAAVRSAKKAARPAKIGLPEPSPQKRRKSKDRGRKQRPDKLAGQKGLFEKEVGGRRKSGGGGAKSGSRVQKVGKGKSRTKR